MNTLLKVSNLILNDPKTSTLLLGPISFELKAQDRICIEGVSGSGKTLFLRSLNFLEPCTFESFKYQSQELINTQIPAYRNDLIYLAQRSAQFDGTVEDNLRMPFELKLNKNKIYSRPKILAWLSSLNFGSDFLDKNVKLLSGGETQVLALLRALQLSPTGLLLDEPTSAIDSSRIHLVESLLTDWVKADESRCLVFVTHDPNQAARLSNQRLELREKRLFEASLR